MKPTEHAVCMRAIEPCRPWIRSGCGSRSRILDCSVDGPRGAKLGASCVADVVGDAGREPPRPCPVVMVSRCRFVGSSESARTFEKLGQGRVVEYHILHACATSSCVIVWGRRIRASAGRACSLWRAGDCGRSVAGRGGEKSRPAVVRFEARAHAHVKVKGRAHGGSKPRGDEVRSCSHVIGGSRRAFTPSGSLCHQPLASVQRLTSALRIPAAIPSVYLRARYIRLQMPPAPEPLAEPLVALRHWLGGLGRTCSLITSFFRP